MGFQGHRSGIFCSVFLNAPVELLWLLGAALGLLLRASQIGVPALQSVRGGTELVTGVLTAADFYTFLGVCKVCDRS